MLRISHIRLPLDGDFNALKAKAAALLRLKPNQLLTCRIVKQSLDARDKTNLYFVYAVDVTVDNEAVVLSRSKNATMITPFYYHIPRCHRPSRPPVIVGSGPAGLFAGLILAKAGLCPIILERGAAVAKRQQIVEEFWQTGQLNANTNVQFGEGGAGTFSDGKLTTGIKDHRCELVLEEFVAAGAPADILYLAKPHIGTDNLTTIVENIRHTIIKHGGEVRFEQCLTDISHQNQQLQAITIKTNSGNSYTMETQTLILAIGHSARDTCQMLYHRGIPLQTKPFAVGVRIEHHQSWLNQAQYGKFANHPALGAADYKLACHLPGGHSAFTFCMCPGGQVVAAASEPGSVVTNGMSYYRRSGSNANSALLVGITPADLASDHPLAGIEFQRSLETAAYKLGGENYHAPVQLVGDFLRSTSSRQLGAVNPSYKPGITLCQLSDCLPPFIIQSLQAAIVGMDKKIPGFAHYDAVLTAVESRSSSPVRILRDKDLQSTIRGIYPTGEGAGYAGGIMSAAVDGIRCAEQILQTINPA